MGLTDAEKSELAALRQKAGSVDTEPSVGEKVGAFAYGAGTGLVGGLGEFEKFAAYDVPEYFGFREPGERDKYKIAGIERETVFPTVKEAQQVLSKVGIKPPREEVSGYQTGGEIVGGLGTSLPSAARFAVGTTTKTAANIAKKAEGLGFKLSPAQVRADVPLSAKGATFYSKQNQSLANKLASRGTGEEVAEISSEFISKRLKDLGRDYDKLYKGKNFQVDSGVIGSLQNILMKEQELGVAGVSTVKQAAQTMLDKIGQKGLVIEGEDLQRLRNALAERARSSSSRGNSREIYNFIDEIDASVASKNKQFKTVLDDLRPKYRNSIILEDLYRNGGIQQGNISLERLGVMLRSEPNVLRMPGKDIDELGEIGRELKLSARWEKDTTDVGLAELLRATLSKGQALIGLQTRPARAVQRALSPETPTGVAGKAAIGTTAGTVTRPFQSEE